MYSHALPESTVCSDNSDKCWNNLCATCKDAKLFSKLYHLDDANLEKEMTWYQWKMVPGNHGKEYLEKAVKRGKTIDAFNYACEILPAFLLHYFIKQKQSKTYEDHKNMLMDNHDIAVLQVDYAESFPTLWQDEVQSAHWNKYQVTVFTSVVGCQDTSKSAVAVSDNLGHTKDSVIVFIDKLISELIDSSVKVSQLWSNGPSSQFKNRFIAAAIHWFEEK